MKPLLIALTILSLGACLLSGLRTAAARLRCQEADAQAACTSQTQLLAQAQIQLTNLESRVRFLKRQARPQSADPSQADNEALFALAGTTNLTAEQTERLLAELGFNWASTGDYLIVSKQTLAQIELSGVKNFQVSKTACQVLAVTPEEREALQAMTQSLSADYNAWAQTNAQRHEPEGDIVAHYTLTAQPEFSLSLSNSFVNTISSTLGQERARQLLAYSYSWMNDIGINGGGTNSMAIESHMSAKEPWLMLQSSGFSGGSMACGISPYQPFPEAFLPLFPHGWKDLAAAEGFPLPKSFSKK